MISDKRKLVSPSHNNYLAGVEMAEAADKFGFVEAVGCHLHASDRDHTPIHIKEVLFPEDDLSRWRITVVGFERALWEIDGDIASHGGGGKRTSGLGVVVSGRAMDVLCTVRRMRRFLFEDR